MGSAERFPFCRSRIQQTKEDHGHETVVSTSGNKTERSSSLAALEDVTLERISARSALL